MNHEFIDIPYIPDGHMYIVRLGKLKRFLHTWKQGRTNHYPICCIFRFSFDDAMIDGKIIPIEKGSAMRRGSVDRDNGSTFVPCNIFHHSNEVVEKT